MPVRVGDKVKMLYKGLEGYGIPAGSIVTITSVWHNPYEPHTLGFVHDYRHHASVASGARPNWNLRVGTDYIILPRMKYPRRK